MDKKINFLIQKIHKMFNIDKRKTYLLHNRQLFFDDNKYC